MKLVPMAGLEVNHYKGHTIEWVDQENAYRVYRKEHPEQTCFYCDCIREAQIIIDEREGK